MKFFIDEMERERKMESETESGIKSEVESEVNEAESDKMMETR